MRALGRCAEALLLAPLIEPGMLALWEVASFDMARQEAVRAQLANQHAYYLEKLAGLDVGPDGRVQFVVSELSCELRVEPFLRWGAEYAMSVGVSLAAAPEANTARVVVRPPSGGGPPLGL